MALLTVFIWSFSYIHVIWLSEHVNPAGLVALRMDFYGIAILGMLLWRRPDLSRVRLKHWPVLILTGFVAGPGYHFPLAWSGSEGRIDAALIGLIIATVPVHTSWLAWLVLKEKLTIPAAIALGLGLTGVAVVILGREGSIDLLPAQLEGPIGCTIAAVMGGGIVTLSRLHRNLMKPMDFIIVTGGISVICSTALHPFADMGNWGNITLHGWWSVFYLGFIALGVAYTTWVIALSGLPAVSVAMYLFLAAVLSACWGWAFQGDDIGWEFFLGMGLVFAGLINMVLRSRGRENSPPKSVKVIVE